MRTIDDVICSVRPKADLLELPVPSYFSKPTTPYNVAFAVEAMREHMTDEGYQLFVGLEQWSAGWSVFWSGCDVGKIAGRWVDDLRPNSVLVQDKREWEGLTADRARDPAWRFANVNVLRDRSDVFKGTVLKDAQHDPEYNRNAADEIGAHFWVTYYHPRIVKYLAPYVRERHLVRTYHSLDATLIPKFFRERPHRCLLSGAVSGAYPLRQRLARAAEMRNLPGVVYLKHPGYHRRGCETPRYLEVLSQFKVAICTSSVYGYAVRKIVEATACGCIVITDLPTDDVLPGIDGNLFRVNPAISTERVLWLLNSLADSWDPYLQQKYAEIAKHLYDYRTLGRKLADDIETLRSCYNA